MLTQKFNHMANHIHIESDIKINLTVHTDGDDSESHSFICSYPETGIAFHESLENGAIHIKLTRAKHFFQLGKKEWNLNISLENSGLTNLRLDVANAKLNFNNGSINDFIFNMANGTVYMEKEFDFKCGRINGAKADLTIMAPRCFESLDINLASGQTSLCIPATEYVVCTQKSLFKSVSESFGNQKNLQIKRVEINGAIISNSISTY
jgi:hypothetical protein